MTEKLLPEAVQVSPGAAIRLSAWAVAAVVVSGFSRWTLGRHADWSVGWRTLLALAPMVPTVLWAWSTAGWIRSLDELQRRIQVEAWLLAALGTVGIITVLNLLQSAGVSGFWRTPAGLGWEGAFAVMFLLYALGCAILNRSYK